MADTYTTEQEQVEAIKKWWKENGIAIVSGIAVGLGGLFGWQYWQGQQIAQAEAASIAFQGVMARNEEGNTEAAEAAAREVMAKFSDSGYAPLAALALSRTALESDDSDAAEAQIRWVLNNTEEPALKALTLLRLARLQLATGDAAAARGTLDSADLPADQALVRELSGDINVELGDTGSARADYLRALQLLQDAGADPTLVEMKLDELGPARAES